MSPGKYYSYTMQPPSGVLLTVWITLAALTAGTPLNAQYYTLRSIEGKKTRVHLAESHPAGLHKNLAPVLLRFDKELMAFGNKTLVADSAFTAAEFNHSVEYMRFAAGDTLPMIQFGDDYYYYAEGLPYYLFKAYQPDLKISYSTPGK